MNLSPGSILMWLNVNNAKSYCQAKNKKFIFSIGALRPEWEYKLRWADPFLPENLFVNIPGATILPSNSGHATK